MKFFLFFILYLINFNVHSQNIKSIKVTYGYLNTSKKFNSKLDVSLKEKDEFLDKKSITSIEQAYLIIEENLNYEMIATKNESIFKSNKILTNDNISTVQKVIIDNIGKINLYQNKTNNELFSSVNVLDTDFLVDLNYPNSLNYEYTSESKFINDFECFKVNVFNNSQFLLSAWYCPKININGGPEFCYNLPGLVLEVNYKSYSIVCKTISFKLNEDDLNKIKKPDGVYITRFELNERLKIAKENLKNKRKSY
jgi:GLPGLI family protein